MLPTNLTTNEVKNSAGTEVEFLRAKTGPGAYVEFAQSGELPNLKRRVSVQHREVGSGFQARRQSNVQVRYTELGSDGVTPVTSVFNCNGDIPIGALAAFTGPKNGLAHLMSLVASQGGSTTILYDCTGYGADAIINGTT